MQSEFQSIKKFMWISSNLRNILLVLLPLNNILLNFVSAVQLISTTVKSNYSSVENEATLINLSNKKQLLSQIWTKLVGFMNWISSHEFNCGHLKNINVRYTYKNFMLSKILEINQKVVYTIENLSATEIKRTNYSKHAIKSCTTKLFETTTGITNTTIAKATQHPHNFSPDHT